LKSDLIENRWKMFSSNQKVYFYDADPAGIIFFANLFKFAHVAFEDFIGNIHPGKEYFTVEDSVIPVFHAEANYMNPIKVGDELRIDVSVSILKTSSFEMSYKIFKNKETLAAEAKIVHVCVDKTSFTKTKLPKDLYEKLKANVA
jgi:YbgC/YbaW family acyl-CoA thioester hydrolase